MTILEVDHELRLRTFSGDADVDLARPWNQDAETGAQGEVYLIERQAAGGDWEVVGDVTVAPDSLLLVVAPGWRGQGIGRRVVLRVVDRARALGWRDLRVREVPPGNDAAHRLLRGLGFVARDDGPPAYVLRLAPLGSRLRP